MNNEKGVSGNIRKYYLFQFLDSLAFFAPVMVLFWQKYGLNMAQIMTLQSIYAIGALILELPTGAFADRFGKKLSLSCGAGFFSLGLFIYGLSTNFWQFIIGELTCATGTAFISGADRAFLHETLAFSGRQNEYKKTEGRARGLVQISQAVSSILGSLIGAISLGLTLTTSAVATFFGFITSLTFVKTNERYKREENTAYISIIRDSLKTVRINNQVLWITVFYAIFCGLVWQMIWYFQPYLKLIGVPIVYFGVIFAAVGLISAVCVSLTSSLEKVLGKYIYPVMTVMIVIPMFVIGNYPGFFVLPLWFVFTALVVVNQTITSGNVLKIISRNQSATILSFQNLLRRLVYAISGPFLGMVADKSGILAAIKLNALVITVILGILLFYQAKKKYYFDP